MINDETKTTPEESETKPEPKMSLSPAIALIRNDYHAAAKLAASGKLVAEISLAVGWDLTFTRRLISDDPAFASLVAIYRKRNLDAN